ncbi:MAG: dihydroorotase [Phycisphaerales bacterium]|nr:dihydroorotase [Phycisphaerales bacterium]
MASLLIAGGRVIGSPQVGGGFAPPTDADVAMENGAIRDIGPGLSSDPADRVIDASGCLVVPGLIDPHVHLREPGGEHKETLETGGRAATAGGFTTVCCMPNTGPALDSPEMVGFIAHRAAATSACRIFTVAAATRGRRGDDVTEIGLLARAGAVGISDDGDCVASAAVMARVLAACRDAGLAFMQHCQETTMTRGASMHAGEVAARLGLTGWPRAAEEIIIERDVRLNAGIGSRYHVQHISSAGSVDIVRRARAAGRPVTAEASPHHLLLTHEACEDYDTAAKMNPPLRERADVDALRAGVADGTITVLATDHAPHAPQEKARPFEDAPFGIIGLETALPLYAEALVATGAIGWERLIELMTIEPARLCGLDRRGLGSLTVGGPGDVTVIDPEMEWTLDAACLAGMSRNTPFLGRRVRGRAVATIVGGMVRFEA